MSENKLKKLYHYFFFKHEYKFLFFLVILITIPFIIYSLRYSATGENVSLKTFLSIVFLNSVIIFFINFLIGDRIVQLLVYGKTQKFKQLKMVIYLFLSYLVVPISACIISNKIFLDDDFASFPDNSIATLAITAMVNSFLFVFYYNWEKNRLQKNLTRSLIDTNSAESSINPTPNNLQSDISKKDNEYLIFKKDNVLSRVKLDEIVYIEVDLNKVMIQCLDQFYEINSTLFEIVKKLPHDFIQVSKSVVINMAFFKELVFERESKRSLVKIAYQQKGETMEDSFYIGRKFMSDLKSRLLDKD